MHTPSRVCTLVFSLALLAAIMAPTQTVGAASAAKKSSHIRVYGYLTDRSPATDRTLDVYSKTHRTTYHVAMLGNTVIKVHTQVVPRSRLQYKTYVIVTCQRDSRGQLQALIVHIEYRKASRSKKKTS